jgi:hypothetical protein
MANDPINSTYDFVTVVDESEFSMLCLLPDYEKHSDSLVRTEGDHVYVTMLQSAHSRMCSLTAEVDNECLALDEPSPIELPELPVPPVPPAPNIPQADIDQLHKLGLDRPPEVKGECNRPADHSRPGSRLINFDSLFNR